MTLEALSAPGPGASLLVAASRCGPGCAVPARCSQGGSGLTSRLEGGASSFPRKPRLRAKETPLQGPCFAPHPCLRKGLLWMQDALCPGSYWTPDSCRLWQQEGGTRWGELVPCLPPAWHPGGLAAREPERGGGMNRRPLSRGPLDRGAWGQ